MFCARGNKPDWSIPLASNVYTGYNTPDQKKWKEIFNGCVKVREARAVVANTDLRAWGRHLDSCIVNRRIYVHLQRYPPIKA